MHKCKAIGVKKFAFFVFCVFSYLMVTYFFKFDNTVHKDLISKGKYRKASYQYFILCCPMQYFPLVIF